MSGVAFGNHRDNISKSKGYSGPGGVIAPVAQDALRAMTRMSSRSLQWWDRINERERLLRVVSVGPRELNGQRNSLSVANQMPLAAKLGSIGGVRSRLAPPKTARTELLSTTARAQSICPERASQLAKRNRGVARCHAPPSRAVVASNSFQSHNPSLAAASPKEYRCAGQTQCP